MIAVLDLETTGVFPFRSHRVVEIGVVVVDVAGTVSREFASVVNPQRDVGPTRVHGITAGDAAAAPTFANLAGHLLQFLSGCVAVAGHNVRFDLSFLSSELDRLGFAVPEIPSLCTLQLAGGGKLSACCADYGIEFEGTEHEAICDARAAARLLAKLLADAPSTAAGVARLPAIRWPAVPAGIAPPAPRREVRAKAMAPPTFLQRAVALAEDRLPPGAANEAMLAYGFLLDRVLEDRLVEVDEGDALLELAKRWGLGARHLSEVHESYLLRVATAALLDSVLTDAELRDLDHVAALLGISDAACARIVAEAAALAASSESSIVDPAGALDLRPGLRVCFTGESQCKLEGSALTRERALSLAAARGFEVAETVTKKLDVLVVADANTQSGKAKKARQYGKRVLHEVVFWQALGLRVE